MSVNLVLKSVFDDKGIRLAQKEFGKVGKTAGAAFAVVGAAMLAAGTAAARFGIDAAKGAEEAAVAQRRLDQIAKSMNLFGSQTARVSKRLGEFAEANELVVGVDADVIKATQAKLLTFKELAKTATTVGGAMDRATMAAIDLAAAGFGSAETNAVQLGKALQDPVKGITALGRAGVTFTAQEKEKIKVLVESGKILDAQNIILESIEQQVGGTAEATASAFTRIELASNQLKDSIGEALLPVVEDFADEFALLVPELSKAFGPAAKEVATIISDSLLPAIQAFGEYLKTPEGIQAVKDFANEFVNIFTEIANFTGEVWKNREAIVQTATAIGIAAVAYGALKVAINLATAAQLLLNSAVLKNPYVLAAVAIGTLVGGLFALDDALFGATAKQNKANEAAKGFTGRIGELVAEEKRLQLLLGDGSIGYAQYKEMVDKVRSELAMLQGQMMRATRQTDTLTNSVGSLTGALSQSAGEANRFANMLAKIPDTVKTPVIPTTTKAEVETTKERFAAVQKVIKDAQKKLLDAEESYTRTRFELVRTSENDITRLRGEALKAQLALVTESQRRLTGAFAAATRLSLGDLFGRTTTTEIETQVKRLSSTLTLSVSRETEKVAFSSVSNIIEGLSKRLAESRRLLTNASQLASEGFSQTFIEQVIETGAETGNALADAILGATPESKAQMKKLFTELETVSETGMDRIAVEIYDKFGLATRALNEQSKVIQDELLTAVADRQSILATSLADAGFAFGAAIKEIKDTFLADLDGFDGWFAGLGNTIDALLAKMKQLSSTALTDVQQAITAPGSGTMLAGASITQSVAIKEIGNAGGIVVDSMADVAGTIAYLQARIEAGNRYITNIGKTTSLGIDAAGRVSGFEAELAKLRGNVATGAAAGTVININVKADTTQSQAMVGKTIGNIVTKYVTTGGQVLVSGQN
jgi:hypothetical protein